mmetsp:Transcript_34782/g.84060  ORF Transcript_34782/g.84060 Transcript_34782/m.84060 type:complete len:87 (+) Transcript_34782:1197-1457(+)
MTLARQPVARKFRREPAIIPVGTSDILFSLMARLSQPSSPRRYLQILKMAEGKVWVRNATKIINWLVDFEFKWKQTKVYSAYQATL